LFLWTLGEECSNNFIQLAYKNFVVEKLYIGLYRIGGRIAHLVKRKTSSRRILRSIFALIAKGAQLERLSFSKWDNKDLLIIDSGGCQHWIIMLSAIYNKMNNINACGVGDSWRHSNFLRHNVAITSPCHHDIL
jgi:hypothetical protein